MIRYYTVDVCHNGHWYQWEQTSTRESADHFFDKYVEDDSFDNVCITLHTASSSMQLRCKDDLEDMPW